MYRIYIKSNSADTSRDEGNFTITDCGYAKNKKQVIKCVKKIVKKHGFFRDVNVYEDSAGNVNIQESCSYGRTLCIFKIRKLK